MTDFLDGLEQDLVAAARRRTAARARRWFDWRRGGLRAGVLGDRLVRALHERRAAAPPGPSPSGRPPRPAGSPGGGAGRSPPTVWSARRSASSARARSVCVAWTDASARWPKASSTDVGPRARERPPRWAYGSSTPHDGCRSDRSSTSSEGRTCVARSCTRPRGRPPCDSTATTGAGVNGGRSARARSSSPIRSEAPRCESLRSLPAKRLRSLPTDCGPAPQSRDARACSSSSPVPRGLSEA